MPCRAVAEYGRKELLAMSDGLRESMQSWREVPLGLKQRGLKQHPKLTIRCPPLTHAAHLLPGNGQGIVQQCPEWLAGRDKTRSQRHLRFLPRNLRRENGTRRSPS